MNADAVKQLILDKLENCDVQVSGSGSHYDIVIKGDIFVGLSRVKQQQTVYACLNEKIADGSIHAVNIKIAE